ncbi:Hypothetical predicted protein [Podarcis lilfordi]|uniref:Uncharacterized protein n=1 Tax=Podarcis lilfordi TaxID=74358 RepID=A0AA35KZD9_9SAUR|nr:Hypothetical predicted protein [Podarcis lilfordi]
MATYGEERRVAAFLLKAEGMKRHLFELHFALPKQQQIKTYATPINVVAELKDLQYRTKLPSEMARYDGHHLGVMLIQELPAKSLAKEFGYLSGCSDGYPGFCLIHRLLIMNYIPEKSDMARVIVFLRAWRKFYLSERQTREGLLIIHFGFKIHRCQYR